MAAAETGPLPPLYAGWMRELLKSPVEGEPQSTCDDCAMCPSKGQTPAYSELFFNPETKCCTYVPEIPNYLAGRILSDRSPGMAAGLKSLRERIRGAGVTPLGIPQSATFEVLYRNVPGLFGRARSIRCPHFIEDGGRCGIWRHRPSVCATWHCKHERGALGKAFWNALHQLLSGVQKILSRWCVRDLPKETLHVLFPTPQLRGPGRALEAADIDGVSNPAARAAAWGPLLGREEEFYRQCARQVDALGWKDIRRIGGTELEVLEGLLVQAWKDLESDAIPVRLRPGTIRLTPVSPDTHQVLTYSDTDPIDVPAALIDVLGYFDGRPTQDALAAISREKGLELKRDLLRQLLDFQVLVDAGR